MARTKKDAANTIRPIKPGGKIRSSAPLPLTKLNVIGRKPVYRTEYDELARRAYLLGYEDGEVADLLGISLATLHGWVNKYETFLEARAQGTTIADMEVADSLRQRALGFKHKSEKIVVVGGAVQRLETEVVYPPDTKAAELWLYNRQSKKWRNRQTVDNEDSGGIKINVTGGLPDDEEGSK
jgi:hypothetical protein